MSAAAPNSAPRLPVVLLWHMHQPQYRDALTGEYVLPWTLLHAIKDYSDMAAHLEDNPAARAVVNFTPVLLEQLEEYAQRVAQYLRDGRPLPDRVLALLTNAPLPGESCRGAARADQGACLQARTAAAADRALRGAIASCADLAPQFAVRRERHLGVGPDDLTDLGGLVPPRLARRDACVSADPRVKALIRQWPRLRYRAAPQAAC